MNQRIQKITDEIERTKTKIAGLQALLPELERKRTDLEDNEIIRLARSANVAPGEFAAFIESIRAEGRTSSAQPRRAGNPRFPARSEQEDAAGHDEE